MLVWELEPPDRRLDMLAGRSIRMVIAPHSIMPLLWNVFHVERVPQPSLDFGNFRRDTLRGGGLLSFSAKLPRVGEEGNRGDLAEFVYAVNTAVCRFIIHGPSRRLMSTAATGQP